MRIADSPLFRPVESKGRFHRGRLPSSEGMGRMGSRNLKSKEAIIQMFQRKKYFALLFSFLFVLILAGEKGFPKDMEKSILQLTIQGENNKSRSRPDGEGERKRVDVSGADGKG